MKLKKKKKEIEKRNKNVYEELSKMKTTKQTNKIKSPTAAYT